MVVALGGCAVWGCVFRGDCKRTSPINEMLRFAEFTVTHGGHGSHSSNGANVIHIALGVNVLVNERSECIEIRIVRLLLYTWHGSSTRLHDARPGVLHVLRYYIACIRFTVRPLSVVVNLLRVSAQSLKTSRRKKLTTVALRPLDVAGCCEGSGWWPRGTWGTVGKNCC
jgi:hypothetical protein